MHVNGFVVVTMCAVSAGCGPLILPCTEARDCPGTAACREGACVEAGGLVDRARAPDGDVAGEAVADRAPLPTAPLLASDERAGGIGLPTSCADVLARDAAAPSGAYDILDRAGLLVTVTCDMITDGGGWTLVADVDGDRCPDGWFANELGCDRGQIDQIASATFDIPVAFEEVRGEARAIAEGANRGFLPVAEALDSIYVDGLSLTLGDEDGARVHLWTFAAGITEGIGACPCIGGPAAPAIVSGEYACSSPVDGRLWEGADACVDDVPAFQREAPALADRVEARIMSPILQLGGSDRVFVTKLVIAVR